MRYVLGVDGGNSKTLAVIADERGEVLGAGRAGNSNHQGIGVEMAIGEVREAVAEALEGAAGVGLPVDAAFFGLAGADLWEDFEILGPPVRALDFGMVTELDNDSIAGLRAGSDYPDAVVVIWGAGTNGAGRNAAGEQIRLPALGWMSGDWGGGGDLGRDAVRLVARAHDGRGGPTALTELVLPALGVDSAGEMIRRIYLRKVTSAQIIGLAPLVFRAANGGDAVACELVQDAAREVVITARALLGRLRLLDVPADVVLSGSVFRAEGALFLDTVRSLLPVDAPRARIVMPDVEPVLGAAFRALDLLGIPVHDDVRQRARASYKALQERMMSAC